MHLLIHALRRKDDISVRTAEMAFYYDFFKTKVERFTLDFDIREEGKGRFYRATKHELRSPLKSGNAQCRRIIFAIFLPHLFSSHSWTSGGITM